MSLFESISAAPADPILGLTEAFRNDPNPNKINLSVGVYQDSTGKTPVLASVKAAEQALLTSETAKSYLPIDGAAEYGQCVKELMFGADHEVLSTGRAATSHTPGGTGALRVAGDFIRHNLPEASIWVSKPTWPNHPKVFAAAGVPIKEYPYHDAAAGGLGLEAMLSELAKIPTGDVVLLHGCCHNPTGVDPTPAHWKQIAAVLSERNLLPLVDFAYQGFAEGLREDTAALEAIVTPGREALVCSSFSKNFGLYRERVGALTLIAEDAEAARRVQSQVKSVIRANYSNPPSHGAAIVTTILQDAELRSQWEQELAAMRARIAGMRRQFVETMAAKGASRDFSFLTGQRGMFSFSGLTPDQVQTLREKTAIYIVGSGRINVAGMTESNMDRLCEAIVAVL
jgi:aspartate/tyrosine/aromatic aminotransferase